MQKLTQAAQGLLSGEGHELSPAMLERVADTLHAAALEPEARDEVKAGCLHRELRHVGLGPAGVEPAAGPSPQTKRAKKRDPDTATLRKRAADARRAKARAQRELEAARARREAAAAALKAADSALSEAQRRAHETEAAQRRAERELEKR